MNYLEFGMSVFETLRIILPQMHPDQFFRMSYSWSEEQGSPQQGWFCVCWEGGMQSGCIQFQAAKQMALEIKDNTADF